MREHTSLAQLTLQELQEISPSHPRKRAISDMDFLETLARFKCIIVPPWVVETHGDGTTRRVARLTYDLDMNLDKATILVDVLKSLRGEEIGLHDLSD